MEEKIFLAEKQSKDEQVYFLIYDNNNRFCGMFDKETESDKAIQSDAMLHKCTISKKVHKYILGTMAEFTINTDLIESESDVINDINLIIAEIAVDIEKIKINLIHDFKRTCGKYIKYGAYIELSDGTIKKFSFKLEDQINLKTLLENAKQGDELYYHADDELNQEYSYEDISTIYKELYNNKVFNQIYTGVVCNWIADNFTEDMYLGKSAILTYGYSNDEIEEKVGELYEQQKLL